MLDSGTHKRKKPRSEERERTRTTFEDEEMIEIQMKLIEECRTEERLVVHRLSSDARYGVAQIMKWHTGYRERNSMKWHRASSDTGSMEWHSVSSDTGSMEWQYEVMDSRRWHTNTEASRWANFRKRDQQVDRGGLFTSLHSAKFTGCLRDLMRIPRINKFEDRNRHWFGDNRVHNRALMRPEGLLDEIALQWEEHSDIRIDIRIESNGDSKTRVGIRNPNIQISIRLGDPNRLLRIGIRIDLNRSNWHSVE